MEIHTQMLTSKHTDSCTHTQTDAHLQTHTNTRTQAHIQTHTGTCKQTLTHIHTHTHTHKHTHKIYAPSLFISKAAGTKNLNRLGHKTKGQMPIGLICPLPVSLVQCMSILCICPI